LGNLTYVQECSKSLKTGYWYISTIVMMPILQMS
jgi:hypothetical protein